MIPNTHKNSKEDEGDCNKTKKIFCYVFPHFPHSGSLYLLWATSPTMQFLVKHKRDKKNSWAKDKDILRTPSKSDSSDLWSLKHMRRVMMRHDMSFKKDLWCFFGTKHIFAKMRNYISLERDLPYHIWRHCTFWGRRKNEENILFKR